MPLQETLERCGHTVTWDGASASGPTEESAATDLVVLDAEGDNCIEASESWRKHEPPPGILLVGMTNAAKQRAARARCTFVPNNAPDEVFKRLVASVLRVRFAGKMSPSYARAALGLGDATDPVKDAERIIVAARKVDVDLVRECLRWHGSEYVTANDKIATLRKSRTLTIPEVEVAQLLDGTKTVQTLVSPTNDDGVMRGRFLWALLSCQAAITTTGPPDVGTPLRRQIKATRRHLLARRKRLTRATHYDVLEVHRASNAQLIDYAARTLALRYSPDRLQQLDLAEFASVVNENWQQILAARKVLIDGIDRAKYDHYLTANESELQGVWAFGNQQIEAAEEYFRRGQAALVAGEVFKAVSSLAGACRSFPDNADYEISLCWAEFRAEMERGADRAQVIGKRRADAEAHLVGRRPWPRALVALALLCAADSDAPAARYHLTEALTVDPNLPAAKQLLGRL